MEILFHENLCSEERKFREISFTLFKFVVFFNFKNDPFRGNFLIKSSDSKNKMKIKYEN